VSWCVFSKRRLSDYVSIYSNAPKQNEETADKTTDEVWATIAKNKKKKKIKVDFKTIRGLQG
jgi:hypothetical protein